MSDTTVRAQRFLTMAGLGLEALEVIRHATQGLISKGAQATLDEITAVVAGINGLSETISRGLQGGVTTDEVRAATLELRTVVAANNAQVDTAIDRKFG